MTSSTRTRPETEELRILARYASVDLAGARAQEIVRWAWETFGSRVLVSQSMANTALAHLVNRVAPEIPVAFLDTGYHFDETLRTRDDLVDRIGVRLLNITPVRSVAEQDVEHGAELWRTDPDLCCRLRKVEPMEELLLGYDAWISGLRIAAAPHRADTPVVQFDERRGVLKIAPMLHWSDVQLLRYTLDNDVPVNPLMYQGYPSIGCGPCTHPVDRRRGPPGGALARAGQDRVRTARMNTYPISLNLTGKRVVVVGAGVVGTRRIESLIEAAARVTVVADRVSRDVRRWASDGAIVLHERRYRTGDIDGAWLVHAATGDRALDDLIAETCFARRTWCIRADDAALTEAWTPATAHVDDITVAVTANADPRRAVAIRDAIREQLALGQLPVRRRRRNDGHVVLVGGGPGDPDLITVRGRRELARADVVVYDRLGPVGLVDDLAPDVETIDAGKRPGQHTLTQDEINAVIVDRARAGLRVVRLKGGDPFVFGRGSEEVQACVAAGVTVEVVPGISSAVAAPAAAGIPVTHRGLSNGYAVITGHELRDVEALARLDLTLVVLMGVATLPDLVAGLVGAGRRADTPVAIVERASTPQQRVTVGTLETITATAQRTAVTNPAVIVIGDVVSVPTLLRAEPASQGAAARTGATR